MRRNQHHSFPRLPRILKMHAIHTLQYSCRIRASLQQCTGMSTNHSLDCCAFLECMFSHTIVLEVFVRSLQQCAGMSTNHSLDCCAFLDCLYSHLIVLVTFVLIAAMRRNQHHSFPRLPRILRMHVFTLYSIRAVRASLQQCTGMSTNHSLDCYAFLECLYSHLIVLVTFVLIAAMRRNEHHSFPRLPRILRMHVFTLYSIGAVRASLQQCAGMSTNHSLNCCAFLECM